MNILTSWEGKAKKGKKQSDEPCGIVSRKATVLVKPRACPEYKMEVYLSACSQNVGQCIAPNLLIPLTSSIL